MKRNFGDWRFAFARRLRAERERLGTQAELADAAAYTQQMISRYESGRVPRGFWFLANVLARTDVDLQYVLTGRRARPLPRGGTMTRTTRERAGTVALLVALMIACESFEPPTGPRSVALSDCDPPGDAFPVPVMDGGGLYGGGMNEPPAFHRDAGLAAAAQVPGSGAVLISLGQSITNAAFTGWTQSASTDAIMVNGACGGCTFGNDAWSSFDRKGWDHSFRKLAAAGLAREDVDVVWMSVTHDQDTGATADQLDALLPTIREAYPNLKQLFVSNRTYAGYRVNGSGEPSVWGEGAAVREFVLRHLGETGPWIGWAGDLWSNGDAPRSDGFFMAHPPDFQDDGLHYSATGRSKIGRLAGDQFAASPFTAWYAP
ncbi:MAG: helix-turn-helix domain-containing protein [Chloroflexi bacterium]|nr:helix-turn-helix domain-containing protein [Chloroflexota bacterium]